MRDNKIVLLSIVAAFALTGCGGEKPSNKDLSPTTPEEETKVDVCARDGHMGYHYLAHDLPSLLSETSEGVNEYWECTNCKKHFLSIDNIDGIWLDSSETKPFSSFAFKDDRLLPLPTEVLDKDSYVMVIDVNSKESIKRDDLAISTISDSQACFDNTYGACRTFKFNSLETFTFQTNLINFEENHNLGEIFTYFYNPGNKAKLSISTHTESIFDSIDFNTGWNRISITDINKIKGKQLKFNVGKLYSLPTDKIKISSFYGTKIKDFKFETQLIDLNISESGYIDQNKEIKLNIIDNPNISKITSISFNGSEISTNEYIKTKIFGLKTGEQTLHVKFVSNGLNYETDYKVILCTKVISTKEDLDLIGKISASLGDSKKLQYDGYFMLANDINYNGEWKSFISRNTFENDWSLQFNDESGFVGTFDGNGHIINGLCPSSSKSSDVNGVSFIYKLGKRGIIKNVGFTNASLVGAGGYVASIGEGTIENVYVKYKNDTKSNSGLGTFFYYDRSNELGTLDKSYKNSNALRVNNCFVDATDINLNYTNTHIIGSKKYGKVLLKNVYSISPTSLVENAVITNYSSAGSYACSSYDELKADSGIINDIKINFNAELFLRNDINIPRETIESESISEFIKNGKTNYFIQMNDVSDSNANDAVSFLVEKIKEFTGANLYVSKNEIIRDSTNKIICINKQEGTDSLEYKISIANNKIELVYNSSNQAKALVMNFLEEIFGYKNFNFDLEVTNIPNKNLIILNDLNKTYHGLADNVCTYGYYDENKFFESGYTALGEELVNVYANDESGISGEYHNQFMFLPPDVYYASHPSWYTPNMNSYGGYYWKMSGVDWNYSNLCFNANGNSAELSLMKNEFYKRIKEQLLRETNINNICIGAGDNDCDHRNSYCTCDACRRDGNANISIIKFLNEMSRRLKADPDFAGRNIYLYTMAYRAIETAPEFGSVTMDDHVGVWIAPITNDTNWAYPLNDEINNSYTANNIKNWLKLTKNIGFYLYASNYTRCFAPLYYFETLAKNNKYLSEIGTKFIYYCEVSENQSFTGFGAFKNYILRHTLFNAEVSYEKLYDNFFSTNGYYGEAGPRLKYYFDELMAAMEKTGISRYGEIYNSHVFNSSHFGGYLGSMSFWKQYSIDEAYGELDPANPNYEIYKKHILAESIFLRYCKYMASGSWYSDDSESKFLADCESLGIVKNQEGIYLSSSSINTHKNNL